MKRTDKKEKQHKRGFFASLWRVVRTILIVAAGAMAAFLLFFAVKLLNIDSWKDFDPDKILSAPQTLIVYDGSDAEAVRLHAKEDRVYKRIDQKLGWTIGGSMTGWLLFYFGFEANVPQTESSLQGIMLMMSLLPACATFISMLFILKYPLTEKKMNEIVKSLMQKREGV